MGFYTVSSSPSVSLNLLDPVIIDDKANLLNVYAENGSGKYAPAIVLYFIERKADAKSTVEAIQTAVDVATLLIPGSQATMTLRILNYADKASSVASILSTATAEDYPELSKVLNVTSLVLGVADFSTNGVQSLKNLNSNPSNAVNLINRSENVLDAGNHIQNVENLAMRILDETPDELMNQVLHSSNPHSRALLEDVLEKERHLAQGADRTDVVAKLDEALEVVRVGSQYMDNFYEDATTLAQTYDRTNSLPSAIHQYIFELYKSRNWNEPEQYCRANQINFDPNINDVWPIGKGGYNTYNGSLKAGMKFDRYQQDFYGYLPNGQPELRGSFTAPLKSDGTPFNYSSRALKVAENENSLYYEIEILQDLDFNAEFADVIPWFGKSGNGKQALFNTPKQSNGFPKTWNQLAEEGLVRITIKSSPNGQFGNLIKTIIE